MAKRSNDGACGITRKRTAGFTDIEPITNPLVSRRLVPSDGLDPSRRIGRTLQVGHVARVKKRVVAAAAVVINVPFRTKRICRCALGIHTPTLEARSVGLVKGLDQDAQDLSTNSRSEYRGDPVLDLRVRTAPFPSHQPCSHNGNSPWNA